MIFYCTAFRFFQAVHSWWNQGAPVQTEAPLLPIISALQALLIKELSWPGSTYYFPRLFFPFPRYLLRPKLLKELQLCDTWYYKNLSLFRLFHFLTFYTLIIACFAVFPFRLQQYSLRDFFPLSFISVVIGNKGFLIERKYRCVSFIFNVLNSIFFLFLICWVSECHIIL